MDLSPDFLNTSVNVSRGVTAVIDARIAQINHLLSTQLAEILHQPSFLQLESAWRGLHDIVRRTRKLDGVITLVLDASASERTAHFDHALAFRDSTLGREVLQDAVIEAIQVVILARAKQDDPSEPAIEFR